MGKIKALMENMLGKANGVATLDSAGNVPNAQLGNAVNKAGGEMTGDLLLKNDKPYTETAWNRASITFIDVNGKRSGWLNILNAPDGRDETSFHIVNDLGDINLVAVNKDAYVNGRRIHHDGNKPSGSYTGNGDATPRTIETGGIGSVIAIVSGNAVAFVAQNGAIIGDATNNTVRFVVGAIGFNNGNITLATIDNAFNASGVSYAYYNL